MKAFPLGQRLVYLEKLVGKTNPHPPGSVPTNLSFPNGSVSGSGTRP